MLTLGATSVTFRKLSIEQIVALAKKAGLNGIEWGGDVHVPHGDIAAAKKAAQITHQNGLKVLSYGSYYKGEGDILPILNTAEALNCATVRIWAGSCDYEKADENCYSQFIDNIKNAAQIAQQAGVTLCFEHHKGTLANNAQNTLKLLNDIDMPNVKTYWQPLGGNVDQNLSAIAALNNKIVNAHVFFWQNNKRKPLKKGAPAWQSYINEIKKYSPNASLIMEFVKGDKASLFLKDAEVLQKLCSQ
jgi:sugar phosphate isomerase/epimerase